MKAKLNEEIVYQAVERGELEVDPQGRIWRVKNRTGQKTGGVRTLPCERRRAENSTGKYLQVRVMVNWRRTQCLAHRLVWRHLYGPIPEGLSMNHKNGDKKDNRPENLELVTYSGNTRHMLDVLKVGRVLNQQGQNNAMAKLTPEAVKEIRLLGDQIIAEAKHRNSHKVADLAEKYGVTPGRIWDVIYGRTWTSVS